MNIPRPTYNASYTQTRYEPGLLLGFQIAKLEQERVARLSGMGKVEPEMPAPKPEGSPKTGREIPVLPREPETQVPPSGPEKRESISPDVVEVPEMPESPEVGVPQRDLPGSMIH